MGPEGIRDYCILIGKLSKVEEILYQHQYSRKEEPCSDNKGKNFSYY